MPFFEWNNSYSVGIDDIDAQHQKLFALLNQLYTSTEKRHVDDFLGDILNDLLAYTHFHFKGEERLMEAAGYPKLSEHKTMHAQFTTKVVYMHNDFKKGVVNPSEVLRLVLFLKDWLINHIEVTDQKYVPYLRNNGIH